MRARRLRQPAGATLAPHPCLCSCSCSTPLSLSRPLHPHSSPRRVTESPVSLADILGDGGALSRTFDGYESRPQQLEMAHAVDAALAHGTPLLVEAGTGTGKSLAYLVPAVRSGLRVVISTATKALGEQIMQRDLPTLARLGLPADATLVKGLSNYVCLRRLDDHRRAAATGKVRADGALTRVLDWVDHTDSGDRADLADVSDDAPVWRDVTSSSETRIGQRCQFFDRCFVTRMRRKAEASKIIVTNHHLFFADLALRQNPGGQALPDYDAVIFDEAHALEDIATEFFGVRVTRARIDGLARDATRAFDHAGLLKDPSRALTLTRVLATLADASDSMFRTLPRPRAESSRTFLRPESLEGDLGRAMRSLRSALTELCDQAREFVTLGDALLSVTRRADTTCEALDRIANPMPQAFVAYTDVDARGGGAVAAAPVEIGEMLKAQLWSRTKAVVLTSATLATSGERGFQFIRGRLGVPEDADSLQLASPFDFPTQAALYVSATLPEPRDPEFLAAAAREVRALVDVTGGGAFLLCTSVRAMRAFAEELRGRWPYETFVQGEAPKNVLLQRFREAHDAVLIATSSFWEGVDVPGHALRLVIMDKLPFDSPDDPVVASRIQRLTDAGRSPFAEYQLPSAALALKQGFGRLIRTRRDVGIVAILDRRLVKRGYGRSLLAALPPASRCHSIEEVSAFWAHASSATEEDFPRSTQGTNVPVRA